MGCSVESGRAGGWSCTLAAESDVVLLMGLSRELVAVDFLRCHGGSGAA